MSVAKDDLYYVDLARRYSAVEGISGALKGIADKVVQEGTAKNLSPKQKEVLDNAETGSAVPGLEEQQNMDDYIDHQLGKDD